MDRHAIRKEVMHSFDLQDLLPVEQRMIDTVIDETIKQVIQSLTGKGYRDPFGRPADAHVAIHFLGAVEPDDEPVQSRSELIFPAE